MSSRVQARFSRQHQQQQQKYRIMVGGQNGTERNQFLRERPHQEKYNLQKQKTQTGFLRHKLWNFCSKNSSIP